MFLITKKTDLNPQMVRMEIQAPLIAKKVRAGQFVVVRAVEVGERIPLTVADTDLQAGTISLVFQKVGFTTQLMGDLRAGEYLQDVVGPLGLPTEHGHPKRAAVVGGGAGCAIAFPQAKALHRAGVQVDMIAGFRSADLIILEQEMREVSDRLFLITDDGSSGNKGFVTDVLRQQLEQNAGYDLVIAIGPLPMMKAVSELTRPYRIETIVSLNPIMIDGTGMCGCCRVTVGGKTRFACVEGPDFNGHEVDFEEAMQRLRQYREQEQQACACRLQAAADTMQKNT